MLESSLIFQFSERISARKLLLFFTLVLVTITSQTLPLSIAQASYYAGGSTNYHYGVSGYIKTLNPTVSGSDFIAQWVHIALDSGSWVQMGWSKGSGILNGPKAYYEYSDVDGYKYDLEGFGSTLVTNSWHTYVIVNTQKWPPSEYAYYFDGGRITSVTMVDYTPVDLEAFSEATSSSIVITTTEVNNLLYWDGRSWPYWTSPSTYCNPIYSCSWPTSHNFWATGGG